MNIPHFDFLDFETVAAAEAAAIVGLSVPALKTRAAAEGIGRPVDGRWRVSKPGLAMLAARDHAALAAYRRGDRSSAVVMEYFAAAGVELPRSIEAA